MGLGSSASPFRWAAGEHGGAPAPRPQALGPDPGLLWLLPLLGYSARLLAARASCVLCGTVFAGTLAFVFKHVWQQDGCWWIKSREPGVVETALVLKREITEMLAETGSDNLYVYMMSPQGGGPPVVKACRSTRMVKKMEPNESREWRMHCGQIDVRVWSRTRMLLAQAGDVDTYARGVGFGQKVQDSLR